MASITDRTRVRIYSDMLGLRSAVRVTGGLAQTVLRFQEAINVYRGTISPSSSYTWVYTQPNQNTTQLSLTVDTSLGAPLVDLSVVRAGDYVIITAGAATGFTGSFPILDVHQTYSGTNLIQTFTIAQIPFTGSAVQQNNAGYQFFRPEKQSIFKSDGRTVVVSQSVPGRVDISIPATTQAVNRDSSNAAYLHENAALSIQYLLRDNSGLVTVDFAAPHGLHVGDQIYLDNIIPASTPPYVAPAHGNGVSQLPASYVSVPETTFNPISGNTTKHAAVLLSNGQLLFAGGDTVLATSANANRIQDAGFTPIVDGSEADGCQAWEYNWLSTAPMNTARDQPQGCTLGSLAVVSGGIVGGVASAITETYNPGSNTWTTVGSLATARVFHNMVDLKNGTCIAIAGGTATGTAFSSTEIFNGSVWSPGPSLNFTRFDCRSVRLSNGHVLTVGGRGTGGFALPTAELYNGTSWTLVGQMAYARQGFGCVILPDDRVLVFGGNGFPICQPTLTTTSINIVEIWDPITGWWRQLPPMQMNRINCIAFYSPATNRVYVFGGASTQGDDTTVIEYLDLSTMHWGQSPHKMPQAHGSTFGAIMPSGVMVINGGTTGLAAHAAPDAFVPGSEIVSSGNLNNLFRTVSAVPTSSSIQFDSSDVPGGYTSIFGPGYQGPGPNPGAEWVIASAIRSGGITVLYLSLPGGVSSAGISVGDSIYVNSLSPDFSSGIKTVTAAAASAVAYADPGGNLGPDTSGGSVSQDYAPGAILRPWKQVPAVDGDLGPYIYDPNGGLAVTGGDSVTTIALAKGQHYDFIEVVDGTAFPSSGFIALGFGTDGQTLPIRLLDKYVAISGNTRLVIDFSFTMPADYPVGSEVTLLAGPSPFVPVSLAQQAGSFYLTASPAGRVAAQALVLAALAAGIKENLVIVYPGDAGLGGAGLPTRGASKLSDIVEVFAGDDVSAEVLAAEEAPVL